MEFITSSPQETVAFGQQLGAYAKVNSLFCFYGDLAAGKTTLIKGLVKAVTGVSEEEVSSPTFGYLNIYEGKQTLYHFDLYRLQDAEQFVGMGFDEHVTADGVCCIEWSERIEPLIDAFGVEVIKVNMEHTTDGCRRITVEGAKGAICEGATEVPSLQVAL